MQQPERMTATVPLTGLAAEALIALRPSLLSMRFAMLAKLHSMGWKTATVDHIDGRAYVVGDSVHLVALHAPRHLQAILVGGSHDGALIPMNTVLPPLTFGVMSSTDVEGEGCSCYECDDCTPDDEGVVWSCWQYAGVARDGERWCWAYGPAQAVITRGEQRMHDLGQTHEKPCGLCRLEHWVTKTSRLRLPGRVKSEDAALHHSGAPHSATFCSACKASIQMGRQ